MPVEPPIRWQGTWSVTALARRVEALGGSFMVWVDCPDTEDQAHVWPPGTGPISDRPLVLRPGQWLAFGESWAVYDAAPPSTPAANPG